VPELPEVETARSLIAGEALNRLIVGVDDADAFVCRPHFPGELRAALTGRTLTAAHRRGKTIRFRLPPAPTPWSAGMLTVSTALCRPP
jgi:formamidopyrimidine-DNA glycosylase